MLIHRNTAGSLQSVDQGHPGTWDEKLPEEEEEGRGEGSGVGGVGVAQDTKVAHTLVSVSPNRPTAVNTLTLMSQAVDLHINDRGKDNITKTS